MLISSSDIVDGRELTTDVCVIGSGPAGMAVAFELSARGREVLLLESGAEAADATIRDLHAGESVGRPYPALQVCRSRRLGGSSNCWAGMCRRMAPEDFEVRAWVPHSGWPITLADLDDAYVRAEAFLGVQGGSYAALDWAEAAYPPWSLGDDVRSGVFQLSAPVRLGEREGATLRERAAITVILEATVTRIGLSANGGAVERLHVARSKGGGAFTVAARTVVLATGGIENARLLLASRDVAPAGVGNDHDLVGRYFMEHAHTDGYAVLLVSGGPDRMRFYDRRARGGQEVWPFLGLSPEVRAREGLLDFSLVLLLKNPGETGELGADVDGAVRAFSGRGEDPAACTFAMGTPSECAPNPDSRVMLAEEADALGVPRVRLDWRLTELDKRTVARGHELVARALAASGVGRLRLRLDDGPDFPDVTMGGCHHMGTTRMHDDPARGVVDRNLKVHGVANLYVAGSSVFPTAGAPNPTLTLTALSMRLADHLLQVTA